MKKAFSAILAFSLFFAPGSISGAPLEGRLSLGYSDTSGNTDEQKVNFDFNLTDKKSEKLNFHYEGLAYYAKSNGEISSDKKSLGMIGEFVQDSMNSYYIESGFLKDQFAGYDQRLNLGAGLYKVIIKEENMNLRAAAGIEITKEEFTDSTSKTNEWIKFGLKGDKMMQENMKLYSFIDFGAPSGDYDSRYEVDMGIGTIFTVNSQFDLEAKYLTNYRKTPLVDGKEKTDSTFITNLVYKM